MKSFLSLLILLGLSTMNFAQSITEGRTAVAYIKNIVDVDLISTLDPDKLTPKEEKKYQSWRKSLEFLINERMLEKSREVLSEKGVELLPLETVKPFGMTALTDEGYPAILFPKRALKKKGGKLDVSDYFLSLYYTSDKPTMVHPVKGYNPLNKMVVKLFNKKGELLKKIKKEIKSEVLLGKLSMKKKEFFSKIDNDSLDAFMEIFNSDIDSAVEAALREVYP